MQESVLGYRKFRHMGNSIGKSDKREDHQPRKRGRGRSKIQVPASSGDLWEATVQYPPEEYLGVLHAIQKCRNFEKPTRMGNQGEEGKGGGLG